MKWFRLLMVLSLFIVGYRCYAGDAESVFVTYQGNQFHYIQKEGNDKVMIFLHGGVDNPAFRDSANIRNIDFLLEDNKFLIPTALKNGFDLLIPVTNDSLNWLTGFDYCFRVFTSFLESAKPYQSHCIAGFSDGGTGSYRIFYKYSKYFDGVVIFNGYPQLKNYHRSVQYSAVTNKKVVFCSTFGDPLIEYEFLLTEYCKQKETNPNTYLYVREGKHSFGVYDQADLNKCFDILTSKIQNTKTVAIHALIENDQVVEFYPYRKKMIKKYWYGEEYLKINREQRRVYE